MLKKYSNDHHFWKNVYLCAGITILILIVPYQFIHKQSHTFGTVIIVIQAILCIPIAVAKWKLKNMKQTGKI